MGEVTANHALDDKILGHLIGFHIQSLDRLAIAQNRDRIGDFADFVQFVRNDDRGDALFLQLEDQLQQVFAVVFIQGRCGFVQNQQLDLFGQRFGDLHQLLLTDAEF
ncbi:hypothetical protein D3C74_258840 [compost metagenome]